MAPAQNSAPRITRNRPQPDVIETARRLEVPDCRCPVVELPCPCAAKLVTPLLEREWLAIQQFLGIDGWRRKSADWVCDFHSIQYEAFRALLIRWARLAKRALRNEKRKACDCNVQLIPPCKHILARDHDLPFDDWAELLAAADPDEFAPPNPATIGEEALCRSVRVAVMETRFASGEHIYHRRDLWRRGGLRVGRNTGSGRNGRLDEDECLVADQFATEGGAL